MNGHRVLNSYFYIQGYFKGTETPICKLNGFYEIILPKKSIIKTIELFISKSLPIYSRMRFRVDLNSSSGQVANWFIVYFDSYRYQKVIVDKPVSDTALLRMSLIIPTQANIQQVEGLFLITCIAP